MDIRRAIYSGRMAKMTVTTLKLSVRQIRQLAKLETKLALDRSAVIRLAIARLVEEEAHRDPRQVRLDNLPTNAQ